MGFVSGKADDGEGEEDPYQYFVVPTMHNAKKLLFFVFEHCSVYDCL